MIKATFDKKNEIAKLKMYGLTDDIIIELAVLCTNVFVNISEHTENSINDINKYFQNALDNSIKVAIGNIGK